jgi:hypothetical protein
MYAKTNPGAGRLPRRQKRVFAVVGVLVVLLLAGLATWGALDSDSYSSSGDPALLRRGGPVVLPDVVPVAGPDLASGPAAVRAGRAEAFGQCFRAGIGVTGRRSR